MNINKINYSQQNQTQQLSFKKLKGIQYVGNFNPEISMEHAKAVKAFKENEAFKKFFQKFDGIAIFEQVKTSLKIINDNAVHYLDIHYDHPKTKESVVDKLKEFFGFGNDIKDFQYIISFKTTEGKNTEENFIKNIKEITDKKLLKEHELNVSAKEAKKVNEENLQKLNEEIGDVNNWWKD